MKVLRTIIIMIMICGSKMFYSCKKTLYSEVYFPYFDFRTKELCTPTPIDVLEMTVDSIMEELDKKIKVDNGYFFSNRFNKDEERVLAMLQLVSDLWIEGWGDGRFLHYRPRRERLEKISDYNNLRDWYLANKDSMNWYFYAESGMKGSSYHLKRDSTGVYAERDSTILPPS